MDPVLGALLGAAIVYLLVSGRQGGAVFGQGTGSGSSTGFGVRPGRLSGATNANQAAASSAGGQGSPGSPTSSSQPGSSAPSRTTGPSATATNLSNVALGLNLAGTGIQLGITGLQTAGAIAGTAPVGAVANPLADVGFLAVQGTAQGVKAAGQVVAQGQVNIINPGYQTGQAGGSFNPVASQVGSTLTSVGNTISGLGGVGAIGGSVVGTAALSGFRGATPVAQKTALGLGAVAGAQTALSAIPVAGAGLSAVLGALAKTNTGQQATFAVGSGLYSGYQAQKDIFAGQVSQGLAQLPGVFSGGGSDTQTRNAALFGAVASRVTALQKGGTLTSTDVAGFANASAYGIRFVNGLDLTKLNLTQAGTNPFLAGRSSGYTAANAGIPVSGVAAGATTVGTPAGTYSLGGVLHAIQAPATATQAQINNYQNVIAQNLATAQATPVVTNPAATPQPIASPIASGPFGSGPNPNASAFL
jgi:hypothetical protein